MARSQTFFQRFRPAGTPGAAAKPGVPADRAAELSAELEPVLALLTDTVEQARRIRDAGRKRAEQLRRSADERAAALLERARSDAEAERSDAAARTGRQAEAESTAIITAAEQDAAAVRRHGDERMGEQVDQIVAQVRRAVTAFVAHEAEDAGG